MVSESSVKTVTLGEDDCFLLIDALSSAALAAAQDGDVELKRQFKRLREEIRGRIRSNHQLVSHFENP